jgi:D-alanyl-D-alanine carboxypeptidase/D-alanyl-D-alanine-endopeptidase (penicillin-binding protein 4)
VPARLGLVSALLLVCLGAAFPAAAHTRSLDQSLTAALDEPGVAAAHSTAMVVELPSGRVVYARNPSLPLEPASNEKLCVTYTALAVLGPAYRFPTEVLGVGERTGSTWHGSLYLKGFGDPSLTSSELARLAGILSREGIRKVTGRIVGDASYFDARETAPGWLPSFAGLESPPLSALVVDRAARKGRLVADPPLAAAIDLDSLLRARGVATGGARTGVAPRGAAVAATIYSPPLTQVLEYMDHFSDNFTAEMLLKAIGAAATGQGTDAAGALVVRTALVSAGIPLQGVRIVDGSGLSRWDRVTGAEIAALLVTIWNDPQMRGIVVGALPVAGKSGTLAERMTSGPAFGIVRAKTGTTDIASALSGFVGGRYAFVTIENGDPVDWVAAHVIQDGVAGALAAQVDRQGDRGSRPA